VAAFNPSECRMTASPERSEEGDYGEVKEPSRSWKELVSKPQRSSIE